MSGPNADASASELPSEPELAPVDQLQADDRLAAVDASESGTDVPETLTFGQRLNRTWCMFVKAAGATFGIY